MTDEEIRDYISTGEPMDKAGAYGIQGNSQHTLRGLKATIITLSVCLLQDLYMSLKYFKEKTYG